MSTSKPKANQNGKGSTVLLRQAQPKYNFQGRKLPKEPSPDVERPGYNAVKREEQSNIKQVGDLSQQISTSLNMGGKPVAVVGASFQTKTNASADRSTQPKPLVDNSHFHTASSMPNLTSGMLPPSPGNDLHPISSYTNITNVRNSSPSDRPECAGSVTDAVVPQLEVSHAQSLASQVIQSAHANKEQMEGLEKERDSLRRDLEVQLQVNAELKKLLVASVGEDLGQRVERLARDRAQLSMDIGGFSKKMSEDYENFDKVSIQADMWRSKYLASRVMVEELGNARAYYALQSHDAQDALQQMLNERHELRTNLLDSYRVLQQVKNAFDPLNSQRSTSLASTNVLDLSRSCQQLSEAVRFRLLPAHVAVSVGTEGDEDLWENAVTRAEQYAHVILSRPSEPVGSIQSGSSHLVPVTGSGHHQGCQVSRFHPHTRHENLTFNCCTMCKGDINVL